MSRAPAKASGFSFICFFGILTVGVRTSVISGFRFSLFDWAASLRWARVLERVLEAAEICIRDKVIDFNCVCDGDESDFAFLQKI